MADTGTRNGVRGHANTGVLTTSDQEPVRSCHLGSHHRRQATRILASVPESESSYPSLPRTQRAIVGGNGLEIDPVKTFDLLGASSYKNLIALHGVPHAKSIQISLNPDDPKEGDIPPTAEKWLPTCQRTAG